MKRSRPESEDIWHAPRSRPVPSGEDDVTVRHSDTPGNAAIDPQHGGAWAFTPATNGEQNQRANREKRSHGEETIAAMR